MFVFCTDCIQYLRRVQRRVESKSSRWINQWWLPPKEVGLAKKAVQELIVTFVIKRIVPISSTGQKRIVLKYRYCNRREASHVFGDMLSSEKPKDDCITCHTGQMTHQSPSDFRRRVLSLHRSFFPLGKGNRY